MSSSTPSRPGEGFIDDVPQSPSAGSSSGSSISEELELPDSTPDVMVSGMRDYDILDDYRERHHESDGIEDGDEADATVETEDWELAAGDFTKQYNRARQHYEALNIAGPSRQIPIPARNAAPTKTKSKVSGVAANPKAQERTTQDKSQRATTEQVLDPRTRLVLAGLINRGIAGKLQRCVSTGKEANVYYAPTDDDTRLAVKIYRTSILNFRSRQAYIEGEYRFRGEYSSSRNPRKMVRLWAEKELRNLRRLEQERVPSPRAVEVKENVLVMEYLGDPDQAAPRLKDANLTGAALEKAYKSLLISMRRMFQLCKLVHADLSEYNVLYHHDEPYIIDVSQSVEHDHPRAFDFLRSDIKNVESFFKRHSEGCRTLGIQRAWEFVTAASLGKENEWNQEVLIGTLEERLLIPASPSSDAVFLNSFIPRGLGDIADPERHIEEGIRLGLESRDVAPDDTEQDEDDEDTDEAEENATMDNTNSSIAKPRGFRHEDPDAKRERKKAIKEENRERRKHKMPKGEKARLIRKTAR